MKPERRLYWQQHLHLLIALSLLPVFAGIHYFSFWIRFDGQMGQAVLDQFQATADRFSLVSLAWFAGLRVCRGWRRSVTFYDLLVLLRAATGGLAALMALEYMIGPQPAIPRSVLLLDWGLTIFVLGGVRSLLRGCREWHWPRWLSADRVPVLIAGAGEMGTAMLRMNNGAARPRYRVVGFVDQCAALTGAKIDGVPVLGTCNCLDDLVRRHRIRQIWVMQGELSGARLRKLMENAGRNGCEVRVVPSYRRLIEGSVTVQPRAVSIEDLLQREPVKLDIENIRQWIDQRVILVTGSAGSIGSEICRQLLQFAPRRIVMVDRSESAQFFLERELQPLVGEGQIDVCIADVLDTARMRRVLMQHRPNVIFHAAAYKHVPLMERHPQEAVRNIVGATRRLADLALEFHCESFVMISTDKAVNPTSVMGACKRVAELYVQSLAHHSPCRFVTVRFGNVLDSAGSVVPLFRQQIAAGGPVTVTHPDIRRYFMTIPEASRLVIQAGAIGRSGQILLLDMGEPVRIVDLARDMIQLSGLQVGEDVAIEFVGLRPGEKLYEDLHLPDEKLLPTWHPKIIVADRRPSQIADVQGAVAQLERLAVEAPEEIVDQLRQIVCGYRREERRHKQRGRAAA